MIKTNDGERCSNSTVERGATQWPEMSFIVSGGELRQAYREGQEDQLLKKYNLLINK